MGAQGQPADAKSATRLQLIDSSAMPAAAQSEFDHAVAAHARHYVALLRRAGPALSGAGIPDGGRAQLTALRMLEIEQANLLNGLDRTLDREDVDDWHPVVQFLGDYLELASEYRAMLACSDQLLDSGEYQRSAELTIEALLLRSRALLLLGTNLDAADPATAALQLALSAGDRWSEARAMLHLGSTHTDQQEQGRLFARSLAIQRELGNRTCEAVCLRMMGSLATRQRNYDAARELLGQAIDLALERGDRVGDAWCRSRLGALEFNRDNHTVARELFEQALDSMLEVGHRAGAASLTLNLGNISYVAGDLGGARGNYQRALAVSREVGDRALEKAALSCLGQAELALGNGNAAREAHQQALALARQCGQHHAAADSLRCLANIALGAREDNLAQTLLREALPVLCKVGDLRATLGASLSTAALLTGQRRWPAAVVIVSAARAQAAALEFEFKAAGQPGLDEGLALLAAAAAEGEFSAADYGQWQAQGEAMSLGELAEFALNALTTQ